MTGAAAVLSLATGDRRYPESLARLGESLVRARWPGRTLLWEPGNFPEGCPSHSEVPFAFKPFCFRAAREQGIERALWLDASCVVVRDLGPLFRLLRERGCLLFRNLDLRLGDWASDEALSVLGLERAAARRLPEIDAAALGIDLGHPLGREFLDRWHAAAVDGIAFRGTREPMRTAAERRAIKWNLEGHASSDPSVRGHRHDQTVAGVLAHRLGLLPVRHGLQKYSSRGRWIRPRTAVVVDRDVGRLELPLRSVTQIRRDRYLGALAQLPIHLGWRPGVRARRAGRA